MATNLVYRNTDAKNRVEVLAATLASGEPTLSAAGRPVVTVTASGDSVTSVDQTPYTISGIPNGGVGLKGKETTLAFDGTWEWPVARFTGVTAASAQGTAVNFITATRNFTNAAVGAGVVAFGYVDFPPDYDKTRGFVPVRIGE